MQTSGGVPKRCTPTQYFLSVAVSKCAALPRISLPPYHGLVWVAQSWLSPPSGGSPDSVLPPSVLEGAKGGMLKYTLAGLLHFSGWGEGAYRRPECS